MNNRPFAPVVFLAGLVLIAAPMIEHLSAGQWWGALFWLVVLIIGADIATS